MGRSCCRSWRSRGRSLSGYGRRLGGVLLWFEQTEQSLCMCRSISCWALTRRLLCPLKYLRLERCCGRNRCRASICTLVLLCCRHDGSWDRALSSKDLLWNKHLLFWSCLKRRWPTGGAVRRKSSILSYSIEVRCIYRSTNSSRCQIRILLYAKCVK